MINYNSAHAVNALQCKQTDSHEYILHLLMNQDAEHGISSENGCHHHVLLTVLFYSEYLKHSNKKKNCFVIKSKSYKIDKQR